ELGGPLLVEGLALLDAHGESRLTPPLRQIVLQPAGDHDPELLCVGGIREVHAGHGTREPAGSRRRARPGNPADAPHVMKRPDTGRQGAPAGPLPPVGRPDDAASVAPGPVPGRGKAFAPDLGVRGGYGAMGRVGTAIA